MWLMDQDIRCVKEIAMCKWWSTEVTFRTIYNALLLCGHRGYSSEYPLEQRLRDIIGYELIDGYSVHYYPDHDDFGRAHLAADIHFKNWYVKVVLWLSEWILLFFCFTIPFLTWKGITKVIKNRKNHAVTTD